MTFPALRRLLPATALPALLLALAAIFASTSPARAHVWLVWADPAPDAAVTAPDHISIGFSDVVARGTQISVTDADGVEYADGSTTRDGNTATVALLPAGPGVYTVRFTVVSADDGHESSDSYQFSIVPPAGE